MIIDCHGHCTTSPPALDAWRRRQVVGIAHPAALPRAAALRDDLAPIESIEHRYSSVVRA